jgi:hypothetical protein
MPAELPGTPGTGSRSRRTRQAAGATTANSPISYSQGTDRVMPTEEKYFLQLPPSAEATLFDSDFLDSDFLASAFLVSDFVSVIVSDLVSALVSVLSEASAVFFGVEGAGCSGAAEACDCCCGRLA